MDKEKSKAIKNNKSVIKKIMIITGVVVVAMTLLLGGNYLIKGSRPYAISYDGGVVCYVKSKDIAQKSITKVMSDFAKKDAEAKLIRSDSGLKIEMADKKNIEKDELLSLDEAVECVETYAQNDDNDLNIKVASVAYEEKKYTPEPKYEKDKKALAGSSVVKKAGKKGLKKDTMVYVTVNGKETDKVAVDSEILDEGEQAVIVKGVLGLPDGEDWQTYDGDPVCNSGEDILVTAKSYVGKVRYVRGGGNLKTGVDCVGFVRAIYRLYGINLPAGLSKVGRGVSYSNAKKGDIIIYAHHVGIYVGGGMMVDATSGKGVSVRAVSMKKLRGVRRVIK